MPRRRARATRPPEVEGVRGASAVEQVVARPASGLTQDDPLKPARALSSLGTSSRLPPAGLGQRAIDDWNSRPGPSRERGAPPIDDVHCVERPPCGRVSMQGRRDALGTDCAIRSAGRHRTAWRSRTLEYAALPRPGRLKARAAEVRQHQGEEDEAETRVAMLRTTREAPALH